MIDDTDTLVPCAVNTQRVLHVASEPGKPGSPPPNWVLRTALGPASLAGQSAVRSTRTQYLGRCRSLYGLWPPGHSKVGALYDLPSKTRGALLRQPDCGRNDRRGLCHGNMGRA